MYAVVISRHERSRSITIVLFVLFYIYYMYMYLETGRINLISNALSQFGSLKHIKATHGLPVIVPIVIKR